MIPILEEPGLPRAPPGKLPSKCDVIRLLWGHMGDNMAEFKGIDTICCSMETG